MDTTKPYARTTDQTVIRFKNRLAGGVAHDFNNLLMTIQGNTSLLRQDLDCDHPHDQRLATIEKAVRNGAKLTRQLLAYARKGKNEESDE